MVDSTPETIRSIYFQISSRLPFEIANKLLCSNDEIDFRIYLMNVSHVISDNIKEELHK